LNGGTQKGQADGFNLDVITKLNTLKDVNGKNILYLICNLVKKEDENFEGVRKDFPFLTEAGKLGFTEMRANLNKLKRDYNLQNENLKKLAQKKDKFFEKGEKLFVKYGKEIEEIEKEMNENEKIFQQTATYFGYEQKDSKYKSPEEFFNMINEFLNEVEKNIPKSEPKKNYNRKFEIGKKIVGNANQMEDIINQMKTRVNK